MRAQPQKAVGGDATKRTGVHCGIVPILACCLMVDVAFVYQGKPDIDVWQIIHCLAPYR